MALASGALRARERDWAVAVRRDGALLDAMARVADGPFHVIHPATFGENLAAFQRALRDRDLRGRVYYGKKANKAGAWLREAARRGGSVDVASEPEFVHALANGIKGDDIGVTGAAKSDALLWLSCRHGATVAIDAIDELERALAIAAAAGPMRILLRVLPPTAPDSRIGLSHGDLGAALRRCAGAQSLLSMEGFSFHLDGYAVAPRAELAGSAIGLCREARGLGLPCGTLSIGGGFACSYVDEEDWRDVRERLDPALFHAGKRFERFYPYHQGPAGADMLGAILDTRSDGRTLASRLIADDVELCLEPSRALLDGAGMSVFPVQGFKRNAEHGIVAVAGLSMSLSEQWKNSEFLPTPLLVQRGADRPQAPIAAAIGGSSCMEYDVLTWRKIPFAAAPRHGDLIVYANTAGYQMDKNESEFHQLPLPPKLAVEERAGTFAWRIDR